MILLCLLVQLLKAEAELKVQVLLKVQAQLTAQAVLTVQVQLKAPRNMRVLHIQVPRNNTEAVQQQVRNSLFPRMHLRAVLYQKRLHH